MSRRVGTLDEKQQHMTQTPVGRLVLQMAVPSILAMLVTSFYNVVDAAFIGRLSTEATAGIGISVAYMFFVQALGFFFGHGSGNYMSHKLGARRFAAAVKMASVGFACPMVLGLVVAVVGLLNLHSLVVLLGATPTVAPFACDYLRYIVLATPFMMTSFTMNNQLRLQGNARLGVIGIASGALLNVVLDPVFIFALDMGVSGASAATAVSQLVGWTILFLISRRGDCVSIDLRQGLPTWSLLREIVRCGTPSLCRQALLALGAIFLNYTAINNAPPELKDSALAAFAVVSRIMMFAFSAVLGICQGFQPVCGFNYGARCYGRVRKAYVFTSLITTGILIVIGSVGYLWAPTIITWFRSEDPALIQIGANTLRWQCAVFPLVGLTTTTNMIFQNLGYTVLASLLGSARQGLFLLPALWLLPIWFGLSGVEAAQAAADMLAFLASIPSAIWIIRHLRQQEAQLNQELDETTS